MILIATTDTHALSTPFSSSFMPQLHEILAGRLGGNIRAAQVYNHDGALLGAAALPSPPPPGAPLPSSVDACGPPSRAAVLEAQTTAAITSHIWSTYEGVGHLTAEQPDEGGGRGGGREGRREGRVLETLILELEHARLVVVPAGPRYLVCLIGSEKAEVGMLMAKAQALGSFLREELGQVQVEG